VRRVCPPAETFGDFFAFRLSDAEHERVVEHLQGCPACHKTIGTILGALTKITADLRAEAPGESRGPEKRGAIELLATAAAMAQARAAPEPLLADAKAPQPAAADDAGRRPVALAIAVVTAIALAGLLIHARFTTTDPRAMLASSEPRERGFAARFLDIGWSPLSERPQPSRTGSDLDLPPGAARYLAIADLRGALPEAPTARELAAVGVTQVLSGYVDRGVETLIRAVAAEPESPELLSELGAAHLARAEDRDRDSSDEGAPNLGREHHYEDLPAALEAIERALERSPHLREALFNRALALERLHLPMAARTAWQRYLGVDSRSAWAHEARQRLAHLHVEPPPDAVRLRAEIAMAASDGGGERLAHLVQAQRYLARRVVQEDLLPGWGDAQLAGNAEALRLLAAAHAIADTYEAQTSDDTLRRAVEEVEQAEGPRRERLAGGHRALGSAARAHDAFDLAVTRAAADRALAMLPRDSPAAMWARAFRIVCAYYANGDVESEASAILDGTATDLASRGRALWILGLWRATHGNVPAGITHYREALLAYERTEETDPVVWLRYLLGEAYGYLGVSGDCWRHLRGALDDSPTLTDRTHAFDVVLGSAMVAVHQGRPRLAADLLGEALANPGPHEPYQIAEAHLWRCRIRTDLGAEDEARDDAQQASFWLAKSAPIDVQRGAGYLHLTRGLLARDPSRAVGAFTQAVESFRAAGLLFRIPGVLLHRSRVLIQAGEVAAADADLRQGAILLEQGTGAPPQAIWSVRKDADLLYDTRVELLLRETRWREALEVAEAGRGWDLAALARHADNAGRLGPEPVPFAGLPAQLEPGVTVLFYSVLRTQAIVWRLQREQLSRIALPILPPELTRLVSAVTADARARAWTGTTRDNAMRLYRALVAPAALAGTDELVIVPDDQLSGLPFAALVNPATGKFLLEERQVSTAPGVRAYVRAHRRWLALATQPPSDALVVGDPRVAPGLFARLKALPGARSEARLVANLYPRRQVLLGAVATRDNVVAALGRHEVVHFSGHAVANAADPSRSSFPLAGDPASAALLYAADIPGLSLTSARTVVLSACETGIGPATADAGSLSLARAFLAAGVPTVVASLWPISDGPSAPLAVAVHRHLRAGEAPAAALRAAQLELLRGDAPELRSPAVWAAFAAFGG
jgi:CHAT domain-containing protein